MKVNTETKQVTELPVKNKSLINNRNICLLLITFSKTRKVYLNSIGRARETIKSKIIRDSEAILKMWTLGHPTRYR